MWNGGYQPPSGPYSGYAPPSGPPPGSEYQYAPPAGPPGGYGGYGAFAPPSGPPSEQFAPPAGPPSDGTFDGYPGQYRPPAGPPSGYGYGHPASPGHPLPPPPGPAHMPPAGVQHYGAQYQGGNQQVYQPFFQYSQCNGRKKALLVGINYIGHQTGQLAGCHNDAQNVREFLIERFGYRTEDMVILLDGSGGPRQQPTRQNMIEAMQWLVRDAQPNDSLFFHFSGHGGQVKDVHGDEHDGFDETIYPVDYHETGHILDDELHALLVAPLPAGCRLTCIFDCCHSGSGLDLPYTYSTEGAIKTPNIAQEAANGLLGAVTSYARGDMGGVFGNVKDMFGLVSGENQKADELARKTRTSPADVIAWSGCKDSQTSADTQEGGEATGAMSWSFMMSLRERPQQTYQELLVSIREILRAKYAQKPQLSSSHPMDVNVIFLC